jgi:hypothetical protein
MGSAKGDSRESEKEGGFASLSGVYPVPMQRLTQCNHVGTAGCRSGYHYQIQPNQRVLRESKTFSDTAFDSVTHHRFGRYLARYCQADACMTEAVGARVHTEKLVTKAPAMAGNFTQLVSGTQAPAFR